MVSTQGPEPTRVTVKLVLSFGQDNGAPTGSETYKFSGKSVSQTTGLYYYHSRWYDPSVGRFVSQDSNPGRLSDPQSLNHYIYVEDSPVNNVDPTVADPKKCKRAGL
jgi:RHS repeat-associated protein